MKKFFGSKKGAVALLLAVVVVVAGFFYNQQQQAQNLGLGQTELRPFNSAGVPAGVAVNPAGVPVIAPVVVEMNDVTVLYEVQVRLEDLSLHSQLPSFVNDLFTKEGEGTLNVKNYIFIGWNGVLRGALVSIEPRLDFFGVGDILMIETNDRELAMTVPGDVVTFHCEVEVPGYMYLGMQNPDPSQLELLELEDCELVRINR